MEVPAAGAVLLVEVLTVVVVLVPALTVVVVVVLVLVVLELVVLVRSEFHVANSMMRDTVHVARVL